MKISYRWLLELTGLDWTPEEVGNRLTLCGTACEEITPTARFMEKVVVGEVLDLQPVEGADKIRKATVSVGSEELSIICGAPNVAAGQKVPVALVGASLEGGLKIKKAKIRGVESFGMICSQAELGISDDHSGIWVLESSAKPGQALSEFLDYDDYILNFELTPDRADSMSAFGIARDLAALAGVKVVYPDFELNETDEKAADIIKVGIDDQDACPRFTARIIRDIKIGPSPWWVQKKLLTAGMRPISNIVDVTNLVMLETGNPIHAFDLDRFGSNEVLVRRAKDGEQLTTLDGKAHTLTPDVLLITNGKEAKAAAGVMGGFDSEVTDETKTILLEVAYFDPSVIRKSRKKLGFVSEASTRFEKGVDPNNVQNASARAAYLFATLCGGKVASGIVDCYPKEIAPTPVSFRPERCNKILGTNISSERMKRIFSDLEFKVSGTNPLTVTAPTFRHDIKMEIDLIEEVARIEGFDAIPDSTENLGPLFTPLHEEDQFQDELRRMMVASGFDEILCHGLADEKKAELLNPGIPQLHIVNPISEELNIMRNSLAQTGLQVVSHNLAHRNLDLKMFEVGRAYFPPDENGVWVEEERLLLLVTGSSPVSWRDKPREYDLYDLTGVLSFLCSHFGLTEFEYCDKPVSHLDKAGSLEVQSGGLRVGTIGLLSSAVAAKYEIKQALYLAEIRVKPLIEASRSRKTFESLPVFPAAPRDLAFIVSESVRAGEILGKVREVAGELAEKVTMFDYYKGRQIPEGKKSIGISIIYRSGKRSLSGEEVDLVQQKVVHTLEKTFQAEIRDK